MKKRKRSSFTEIEKVLLENILKEIKKMAATLKDLQDAIADIGTKVDADVAQDVKVVEAINALIAKVNAGQDFSAELASLKAAGDKLSSDNAAVQAAIDAANPPA